MCEMYIQISLCGEENPILSSKQSKEENSNNVKKALDYLGNRHIAMLDGDMFDVYQVKAFVTKASSICDCNSEELMLYADGILEGIASPIN